MKTQLPTKDQITKTGTLSGSGSFSSVYILPGAKAVKICNHAHADAWLYWAVYCVLAKAYNDDDYMEFLPTIHGVRIDLSDNSYTAMVDELVEFSGDHFEDSPYDYDAVDYHVQELREFFEGIGSHMQKSQMLDAAGSPGHHDLVSDINYDYNWMTSDQGDCILTDPTCFNGWSYLKDHPEDNGYLLNLVSFIKGNPVLADVFEIVE